MKIRRGLPWILAVVCSGSLVGCSHTNQFGNSFSTRDLSSLQIRALQTRSYGKQDSKEAIKIILNVLQDEGYVVDYGNVELGLLHASKINSDDVPSYADNKLDLTVNLSTPGDETKIRLSIQQHITHKDGYSFAAFPVLDPQVYQALFAKLERGFFLQKEGL